VRSRSVAWPFIRGHDRRLMALIDPGAGVATRRVEQVGSRGQPPQPLLGRLEPAK
jgi:hypothetical protein